jgi:tetratricopeptide (TPR) repeat protein
MPHRALDKARDGRSQLRRATQTLPQPGPAAEAFRRAAATAPPDTTRVRLLLRYVEALGGGDVTETGRASREALALARTLGDRRGEAGALFGRAVSAMLAGDFADADADADSAAHLARAVDDVRVLARSLTLRGNTAMRRGDLDAALAHYTAALATTDDSVTVAKIASNAANVYERLGRLPEALVLYRRALGIVRAARDTASEALVLGNVGAVFTRLARDPGASGTRRGVARACGVRGGARARPDRRR